MRIAAVLLVLILAGTAAELAAQGTPQPAPKPGARPGQPPARPTGPRSPFTPPLFKLVIGTEAAYPPFNYLDRKGLPAGFEMELAQEACQRMRAECDYTVMKWDDLIPALLDKKLDVLMSSLEVNNERRRRLGLTRTYYRSPGAFIAWKGAPYDGPPALLRNKKIGVQKDSSHADWLDKSFRRSALIKRYATLEEALKALVADEVDAVFGDKVQLWLWAQKPDNKCCEVMGQDIKDTATLGFGVSAGLRREDIKQREAMNKAFAEMMADGTYKALNAKYFPFPLN